MNSNPIDQFTGKPPVTTADPVNMSSRRLQLVWSIKQEEAAVIKVAFASTDRLRVNQHFGAAEGFAIYEVTPERATLVGVGEFAEEAMDGNEDKLTAKVDFLAGCAAVYVMAIGASAIKKLMAKGVQPIRINEVDAVDDLLGEISRAMTTGGVAWIDRAIAAQTKAKAEDRFSSMEAEGWQG